MPAKPQRRSVRHRAEPDDLALRVGLRVRRLRLEKDFSFDAFVEESALGRGYVSELERGLVVPSVASLAKLAAALEVTMADLVLGDTPRERLFEMLRDADDGLLRRIIALVERSKGQTSTEASATTSVKRAKVSAVSRTRLRKQ